MKKLKNMYAVGVLIESHKVRVNLDNSIDSTLYNLPLQWADGMVGIMPIFDNMESAQRYAGDRPIIAFELEPNKKIKKGK